MSGTPDFFYREAIRLGYVARSAFKLLQIQKQYKLIKPGSSILDLGCAPGAWLQVACQSLGPLKNGGCVVGIDVKKVKVPSQQCDSRVQTVCADVMNLPKQQIKALSPKPFFSLELFPKVVNWQFTFDFSSSFHSEAKGFSVILSDMCPPVSGIKTKDAAISAELGMRALDLAVGQAALGDPEDVTQNELPSDCSSTCTDDDNGILQPGGHLVIKFLESEDAQEFNRICKPIFKKASWLRPKATRSSSREIYLICQSLNPKRV
ncbi:hypothetical protein ACFE04_029469 [Oxalis oulophora]